MKIALIGAGGVRTPLLVHGLANTGANVRLEELAFWDTDPERLKTMRRVAQAMAKRSGLRARLTTFSSRSEERRGGKDCISRWWPDH